MVIVKASTDSEAGVLPSKELIAAMGKFNEELVKAGGMLAAEGPQPSSKGARQVSRLEAHSDRSALSGDEGTGRRLLADPGEVERRGDRMG